MDRSDIVKRYDSFVFDLDNTLYTERLYLEEGYRQIAHWIEEHHEIESSKVYEFLMETFTREGREKLFDKMELTFGLSPSNISHYLHALRSFQSPVRIPLLPEAAQWLQLLDQSGKKMAILTNGNPDQQRNKIANLVWPISLDHLLVVLANEWKPKPAPDGLEFIKRQLESKRMLFVGDDAVDEQAAKASSVEFMYSGEFFLLNG